MRVSTRALGLEPLQASSSRLPRFSAVARPRQHLVSAPARPHPFPCSISIQHRSSLRRGFASHATTPPPDTLSPIPEIAPEDTYDIVIIGAGPAGLALACALLSQPSVRSTSRILLLDGASLDPVRRWDGQGEWENRVSSLTAENVAWLDGIGAWKHIKQDRSCPVEEMIVWANPSPSSFPSLHFPPLGHPMARMTENLNLQSALLKRLGELDRPVDIRERARVGEMRLGEGGRWVGLRIGAEDEAEGQWVRGSVVIGADGPNSPVRRFSQIDSISKPYDTHALVATLHHPAPVLYPNNTAFQRFLPTGPLAFLPLSPTASTMVWSTLPSHCAKLKTLSPEALTIAVNAGYSLPETQLKELMDFILASATPPSAEILISVLGTFPTPSAPAPDHLPLSVTAIPPKSVASFPLRLTHAETYLGPRTILLGDAAHTTHPLAGQGLNMGLADARSLSAVFERVRQTGGDLGSHEDTKAYPKERYAANQLLLSAVDTLNWVFKERSGPVNWVRGTGLEVLNEMEGVKRLFMGGAGARPEMAKGKATAKDREFGVGGGPRAGGWPVRAAGALEGWIGFKSVVAGVAGLAGEGLKNGMRRAADAMEKK